MKKLVFLGILAAAISLSAQQIDVKAPKSGSKLSKELQKLEKMSKEKKCNFWKERNFSSGKVTKYTEERAKLFESYCGYNPLTKS